jgi:D-beta-D-heptose 7-phosphate kinase/D-beta-D-heptose 1-phosphate adenosyltransferase
VSDNADLAALVEQLAGKRVLCVGDVMLDRYVYGTVERISPEAPIPILAVVRETAMLGGAGNVVRNLAALKASCCFVSLIGEDPAGREVTHRWRPFAWSM